MQIYIGSDHAGFQRKEELKKAFPTIEWVDLGTHQESSVDYPDFAHEVAKKVQSIETINKQQGISDSLQGQALGVLICGSGQGMAITANKYSGIRAGLCYSKDLAQLSREHNNANILCLGARFNTTHESIEILKTFLATEFAGGRHQLRTNKIG